MVCESAGRTAAFQTRRGKFDDWFAFIPPPRGEVDRREPVGWGAVFDAGILTPPAALFERDSLPIKGRDNAMLDRFAA